ncbi:MULTISPECIES: MFS transporter [Kitasatospora]|uniref:MFS transporter n=1 Tax=Kitasatospora TaxID=2063 RepID=UPI000C70A576|nr:MFS transporter [Kitasatospora sp. GP30]MDH6142029.1 EmrB/QacA subfamily drug resistance transporter [Kitasatospora sp. GP30]
MGRWKALAVLGTAQFLMVLDTAVMNVSISQLVHDFHTDVTTIQAIITLYALVMAAFMITGGKLGDVLGRRRAFGIGLVVYGVGSLLTAVAPVLWVLALGWSVIEGLGAAVVLPALAALVAGCYQGRDRAIAYGVIGGMSGVGIAVGPLLGGWVTTYLTWRLVFAGEAVVVVVLLSLLRWIAVPAEAGRRIQLDGVGAGLSAAGLALVVLGVLQSSSWGLLHPRNSPFTIFGFSPTLFVIAAGGVLLALFTSWERRREKHGLMPLVRLSLLRIAPLRAGLVMLLTQSLILLGLFFVIPLYLQVVQGFNAFETGLRLLPVSITMLVAALGGSSLARVASPRLLVRCGLVVMLAAICWLLATIRPQIDDLQFALAMALLGLGMGLLASQLGNVVQSSVGEEARSEAGGLQNTAQQFGSSLGTALIGAILIGALAGAFNRNIAANPQISDAVREQTGVAVESGVNFVPTDQVSAGLAKAGVPADQAQHVVDAYAAAQLGGLKVAILTAGGITLGGLAFTRRLPAERLRAG